MAGGKKEPIVVAQIMGKMNGGGVEAVIMNYYRHIDRSKIQFDFICDEDSTNIPREEIEKLGGHVIICPPYQKLFKYMKFLTELFREKKYRIVHSNINTLSVFPLKVAKKAGVPVRIAHSHNTSNPKEFKRNILKNILRKFSKKYATDYFACSEVAGRYQFGDKAFDEGKVTIIHNAIDVEKFKFDPEARKKLRKEIGIKEDDFVIGHIGRFVSQKNHTFLIDVFAEVKKERKNAKLVLVGQGPLREEIEEKVKKLGLEKDVFFLGQRDDTNKLYSVFDVFCLPSLYEGLPVVGIEAQTNGVPCIFAKKITKEICININTVTTDTFIDEILRMKPKRNNIQHEDYDIDKRAPQLADRYKGKCDSLMIITTGLLPVPATCGGAVEVLTERIIEACDDATINVEVVSIYEKRAVEQSKKYKNCKFTFIKTPQIIILIDKIISFVSGRILRIKKMTTFSHLLQRLYFINVTSKIMKKENFEKILVENSPSLYLALKWRKNYRKYQGRVYCHLHNLIENMYGCGNSIASTKKMICVSHYVANDTIKKTGIKEDQTIVVKNCIDTEEYLKGISKKERKELRGSYNIKEGEKLIIFSGRLTEEKGLRELLQALKQIHVGNYKLLIVGGYFFESEIKNKYLKEIKTLIEELRDRIVFTGYVKYQDMHKLYAIADFAVLRSIWEEPAGQTMIEALTSGLPLITTKSGGIPEYVPEKATVLIDNNKELVNELAKTISLYLNDEKALRAAKKYARDNVDMYKIVRYRKEMMSALDMEIDNE